MRILFWLIGLFALAAGLALIAEHNTGYVLVVSSPYRVQLSLNLFALMLVVGFLLAYLLLRLIRRTLQLPGQVGRYRKQRRRDKAQVALRDSVRLYLEGRYAQSLKEAGKASKEGESRGLATIMAGRAAYAMRDDVRYREWMGKAAELDAEIRTARLMTEADLALDARRFDEAASRLEDLKEGGERHVAAQRLSLRSAQALGHWEEVVRLSRQLVKHKAMSADAAAVTLRRAHLENMKSRADDASAIADYWKQIPSAEQRDRLFVERAVPLLVAAGQGVIARRTIEELLDKEWEPALAAVYADCCTDDQATAGIARAEGWLRQHPKDDGLLLSLGRLCLQVQLWGKAQSYLEASLAIRKSVAAHLALARLADRLDRGAEAQKHYRAAAELSG